MRMKNEAGNYLSPPLRQPRTSSPRTHARMHARIPPPHRRGVTVGCPHTLQPRSSTFPFPAIVYVCIQISIRSGETKLQPGVHTYLGMEGEGSEADDTIRYDTSSGGGGVARGEVSVTEEEV